MQNNHNFGRKDFEDLAQVLNTLELNFLTSINDYPDVRKIFKGFRIQPVALKYCCMGAKTGGRSITRREVLIRNYKTIGNM